MKEVVSSSAVFFSYALLAIFAQNAVFTRALGVSRMVQLVGDDRTSSALFGMMLCITQVLVAPVAFLAGGFIAPLDNRAQLRPLVYIASIAVVCLAEHLVLWLLRSLPRRSQLLRIVPLAALNSGVLGTVLVERTQTLPLARALALALAAASAMCWRCCWSPKRAIACAAKLSQSIPRPAHHAGVYRRAGAGDLWLYRTLRHPVMQTGRKGYHG